MAMMNWKKCIAATLVVGAAMMYTCGFMLIQETDQAQVDQLTITSATHAPKEVNVEWLETDHKKVHYLWKKTWEKDYKKVDGVVTVHYYLMTTMNEEMMVHHDKEVKFNDPKPRAMYDHDPAAHDVWQAAQAAQAALEALSPSEDSD